VRREDISGYLGRPTHRRDDQSVCEYQSEQLEDEHSHSNKQLTLTVSRYGGMSSVVQSASSREFCCAKTRRTRDAHRADRDFWEGSDWVQNKFRIQSESIMRLIKSRASTLVTSVTLVAPGQKIWTTSLG